LRVMAGDTVRIHARAFYKSAGPDDQRKQHPAEEMIAGLLQAFGGHAADEAHGTDLSNNTPLNGSFYNGDYQRLKQKDPEGMAAGRPKAYLNFVLFNDQFKLVDENSGVRQVKATPNELQELGTDQMVVASTGFLYVYTSNETEQDMFFDNVTVAVASGPVLEETHYYPFGLTMAGISSKALKSASYPENRMKYNGKELQSGEFADGSGLELYDYGARMYDAQIGRWNVIDPLSDQTPSHSPYNYVANNPIMLTDPDGRYFTGDMDILEDLQDKAGKIKASEGSLQEKLKHKMEKRAAKGKNTDRLEKRIQQSKDRVAEIDGMVSEIEQLGNSETQYNINTNYSGNTDGATSYNADNGAVEINISKSYGISGLAHELKHAFQFEKGQTDFNLDGNRGFLHDITDEISAYRRQFAITGQSLSLITDDFVRGLSSEYKQLPGISLDHNSTLYMINATHKYSSGINYINLSLPKDASSKYIDVKRTLFSNYISH